MSDHYADERDGALTTAPVKPMFFDTLLNADLTAPAAAPAPDALALDAADATARRLALNTDPTPVSIHAVCGHVLTLTARVRTLEAQLTAQTRAAAWANDCVATVQAERDALAVSNDRLNAAFWSLHRAARDNWDDLPDGEKKQSFFKVIIGPQSPLTQADIDWAASLIPRTQPDGGKVTA